MTTHKSSFQGSDSMAGAFYRIVFIMSILLITLPASSSEEVVYERKANWLYARDVNVQSITWVSYLNETMKWGDRVDIKEWALGNFTIELTDLMKDATGSRIIGALMTITGENKKSQVAIGSDESQIVTFDAPFYDDEMRISASINGSRTWSRELFEPNVTVTVFLRGKPDINISYNIYRENPESNLNINTTDNIQSNKLFYIQISLENKGNTTLENSLLDINLTNFTVPHDQLSLQRSGMTSKRIGNSIIYDLNDLIVNEIQILNLGVIAPITPVNKTSFIPLRLTGRDNKNVTYTFGTERQLIVTPFIEINKQVGPYFNYSGTDVLYVNELFWMNLYIKNHGNQDITLNLTDTVPDSFVYETEDNKSLNWRITIPPKSSQTISYSVKPTKYKETVTIPEATAGFEFEGKKYSVDSNDIEVKIKGADVILTKAIKIDQQSNGIINVTITINAKNLGDQRVFLKINDSLPHDASLVNGTTSKDNIFLEKNEVYSYSYETSVPSGKEIILPAAKGYFLDFKTYIEKDSSKREDVWRKIESNKPVIGIRQPQPVITPENISQKPENITLRTPAKKEEGKTKLGIIKNFILELIRSIMGQERIEDSDRLQVQHEVQPIIKRIEETHSSFTWTVGWVGQENANASGGTWKVSETPGSKVTVSFTGTGVALLYGAGPEGGIASIELDGKPYTDIDMYSPIPQSNINKTISKGLENTRHALSFIVSSNRNPSASNSVVVIDAIEIAQP